jgi:competence protein ComEC
LLALGIILLYLTFVRPWAAVVLIAYIGYLFLKNYALKKMMLFLIIIYGAVLGLNHFKKSRLESGTYEGKAYVVAVVLKEDYAKVILEINKEKVSWITDDMALRSGESLYVKGILLDPEGAHVPHGYDERKSLKYQSIYHKISMEDYKVVSSEWTLYTINELCNEYYDRTFPPRVSSYLKALVLGNKNDLDQDDMTRISILGISHLFVVSGLHINLLILIVEKLLSFLRVPDKYHSPLLIIFLTSYLVATAFLIAVVRVFVGEMLKLINKKYRFGFDSLDLLSVNFLFVGLLMPLAPYQYGFILTYITTFSITVGRHIFSQYENYLVQSLAISIVSFFITLPIIINISYRVNFLSIIYNLFYIPLVSFIILPLSMIITFLPYLSFLYEILITGFSNSLTILSGIDFLMISFPEPSLALFMLYYGLLLVIFAKWEHKRMNWKTAGLMVLLLVSYKYIRYLNPRPGRLL